MAFAIQGRNGNCAWPHITGIAPLRGSLRAAPFGTGVPTLVLSPQDRSATICFLDGRTRFPPYLPHSCKKSAQVDLRAPSNVAAHSLSLQGTPTDVFQFLDMHLERFTKRLPFSLLSRFPSSANKKSSKTCQKLH